MKKNGFTLQEALITVGIIGIIAAITAPGIVKMMPDRNQQTVLKVYETLTKLNQEMLINSSLYWSNSDNQGCDGLACATTPIQGSIPDELLRMINSAQMGLGNNFLWLGKYAAILAYNMHYNNFICNNGNTCTFNTESGMVSVGGTNDANGNPANITVGFDVSGGLNGVPFDANNNPDPDLFNFAVALDGRVQGADLLTRAYINDPTNSHAKKDLLKAASDTGLYHDNLDNKFPDFGNTRKTDRLNGDALDRQDHSNNFAGNTGSMFGNGTDNSDICGKNDINGNAFSCGGDNFDNYNGKSAGPLFSKQRNLNTD